MSATCTACQLREWPDRHPLPMRVLRNAEVWDWGSALIAHTPAAPDYSTSVVQQDTDSTAIGCVVILAGGLGNQLFQLCAGLFGSPEPKRVTLIDGLMSPRAESTGLADIFHMTGSLSCVHRVTMPQWRARSSRRTVGWRLAASDPTRPRYTAWPRIAAAAALNTLVPGPEQLNFRGRLKVESHSDSLDRPCGLRAGAEGDKILVGYFQNAQIVESADVTPYLAHLGVHSPSKKACEVIEAAKEVRPVVVHVRRADYRSETEFGLIAASYYERALSELRLQVPERPVWIFSDEPETARNLRFAGDAHIVDDSGLLPAETLEAMRHGAAYAIANSTFSYWGAVLRFDRDSPVVFPRPWFRGRASGAVCPVSWVPMQSTFTDEQTS